MRVLLLCLSCMLACNAATDFEELFKTDPTPLLTDESKWKDLFNCLLDKGSCAEYQNVKDALPKLLLSNCGDCTPQQKEKFDKTMKQFLDTYPVDYMQIQKRLFESTLKPH